MRKAVLFLLACILFLPLCACGGHVMPEPTLNFDTLLKADYFYLDDAYALRVGDNSYKEYCPAQALYPGDYIREMYADANVPENAKQGEVIAYSVLEGHFISYYAEIGGLSQDDWLLRFYDDGAGEANEDNVFSIYKNIEVTEIPDWLQKVYDIENAPPPASNTDVSVSNG